MDQVEQAIRIPVEPSKVPAGKGHVVDWSGHHLDSRPVHQPPLCRQPVGQGQVKTNPFHHKTMVTVKNRVAAGRHQRKKALQALQWQPIAADRGKPEGRAKGAVKPTAPRRDGQINQRDRQGAPVRLHQRHASIPIPDPATARPMWPEPPVGLRNRQQSAGIQSGKAACAGPVTCM